MRIVIQNPKQDQYGNSKENIFLAFDFEKNYLGSAYVYPALNFHQTYEIPYVIFIDVNIENDLDDLLGMKVRQKLFDQVLLRAKELRMQRPDLKARVYSGFPYNKDKFDFYIKNGFDEDYSMIMEADIPGNFTYKLPDHVSVIEYKMDSKEVITKYQEMYNETFVRPFDLDTYMKQETNTHFKNLAFLIDGKLQGGCTLFEKGGFGCVETLYVLPESRGKGLSKIILNYSFNYFLSMGLTKTQLEVWEINKRAVNLYKSFGYYEVRKNLMFPGVTL
jgi:ribosomal protein S18 acetylase RimI-like enzyme